MGGEGCVSGRKGGEGRGREGGGNGGMWVVRWERSMEIKRKGGGWGKRGQRRTDWRGKEMYEDLKV